MQKILEFYKNQILTTVIERFEEVENINEIRINLSAVFKCEYRGKPCILKYSLVGSDYLDRNSSDYLMMHAEKMIGLSQCPAFPDIYDKYFLQVEGNQFLIVLEEFLPYPFSDGMLNIYEEKNKDVITCVSSVLLELLKLYSEASAYGFVSHRDLSFDNIMFDEEYNIKMIDLGSAKSTQAETTVFHIAAPTKKFYSAPEYEDMHLLRDKTHAELVKAEIYTIGLLMLSLLISLKENLFEKNIPSQCGIVYWGKNNGRITDINERLSEANKREYTNYVLINIFSGNDKNTLYKILKGMTDKSVSARIPSYEFIIKVLEREV